MAKILLTAFGPFDPWQANSSEMCLAALETALADKSHVVTRVYDVDFAAARRHLAEDLSNGYDFAFHLGQAAGRALVSLEAFALNTGGPCDAAPPDIVASLEPDGPAAYRTQLPLVDWAHRLASAGIPAEVSYHAGTYLCNATFYWSRHFSAVNRLPTRSAFFHLPLDPSQAVGPHAHEPALPCETSARAISMLLQFATSAAAVI